MKPITLLTIFAFMLLAIQLKADSWKDPAWIEMIYRSDLIALVEYTSSGDFQAMAKPLVIYKGDFKDKEILISGFPITFGHPPQEI